MIVKAPLRLIRDCDHPAGNAAAVQSGSTADQRYQAALVAATTSLVQAMNTGPDDPGCRGWHLRAAERSLRDAVLAHIELGE